MAWTAGTMVLHDKIIGGYLSNLMNGFEYVVPLLITATVLLIGYRAQQATEIPADAEMN